MIAEQPRTYKHQLSADDFIFAFTATADEFAARAGEMRGKGVERMTYWQARDKYKIPMEHDTHESKVVCIEETEIIADPIKPITLSNLIIPYASLLLKSSRLPRIKLQKCLLTELEENNELYKPVSLVLIASDIGDFTSERSDIGQIIICGGSTIGDLRFSEGSKVGKMFITDRREDECYIRGGNTIGNFEVTQESALDDINVGSANIMGDLSIVGKSKVNDLYIMGSSIGDVIVQDSKVGELWLWAGGKTGNFRIERQSETDGIFIEENSTTGDFNITNSQLASFEGIGTYSSITLQEARIPLVRLTKCHIPALRIGSGCKVEIYVEKSVINLIDLRKLTVSKETTISLFNCQVFACLMEEFAVLGQLYLRQISLLQQPFPWQIIDSFFYT